jgi:hypothetical protein
MLFICPQQPGRAIAQNKGLSSERNGAEKISNVHLDATTFLKNFEGLNHQQIP